MTIKELLKDKPDVLKAVEDAIKSSGANFVDLKDGGYVDVNKYNNLETRHNTAIQEHANKVKELEDGNKTAIQAERDKLAGVVRNMAVDNAISALGIDNKYMRAGIKSDIQFDKITLDENYNITGGLDEQIKSIKEANKDMFTTPTPVSTGQALASSSKSERLTQYTSADIDNMSADDIVKNLGNIIPQLGTMK